MSANAEVAVVGGGLVGAAAAAALAAAGLSTVHFAPPAPTDRRTSALMVPTLDFLTRTGLVGDPAAVGTALTEIRIIDATGRLVRAGESLFEAAEFGFPAFGYNIANTVLHERFAARAAGLDNLTTVAAPATGFAREAAAFVIEAGRRTFRAGLLVGADGRGSKVRDFAGISARVHRYEQAALVADLRLERPLGTTSVEFHYPEGPFTLVPAGGAAANLVWIDRPEVLREAREATALGPALAERSSRLFGQIEVTAGPHVFELASGTAGSLAADGIVLVGEAAHAVPPIGAQGLNMGLRDVADLADLAAGAARRETGWAKAVGAAYHQARMADVRRTTAMVDTLFRSLVWGFLPADVARSAGLMALRNLGPLRRRAFEMGMGGGR